MDNYEPIPLPDRQDLTDEVARERVEAYYHFIKQRHSVRDFTDQPVPRDIIETAIRAAGTAPSGTNHQPWHFVCVSDAGHSDYDHGNVRNHRVQSTSRPLVSG